MNGREDDVDDDDDVDEDDTDDDDDVSPGLHCRGLPQFLSELSDSVLHLVQEDLPQHHEGFGEKARRLMDKEDNAVQKKRKRMSTDRHHHSLTFDCSQEQKFIFYSWIHM